MLQPLDVVSKLCVRVATREYICGHLPPEFASLVAEQSLFQGSWPERPDLVLLVDFKPTSFLQPHST